MAAKVFKFLNDFVAVYTPKAESHYNNDLVRTSFNVDKMSYKDFYEMLREINEKGAEKETVEPTKDNLTFYKENVEKYKILMDKLNYKRLPLNLKQYSLSEDELFLTLEVGGDKTYFMDRVYHDELGYINKPLDKTSVYIVVLNIGFTRPTKATSIPKPNRVDCISVHRKNKHINNHKTTFELEEIPYLHAKLKTYLDENINAKKGSKIKVVKETLLNKDKDTESILRFVTDKDLKNEEFSGRMEDSIKTRKPIDWKGLTY